MSSSPRYKVLSASSATGTLHQWHAGDGAPRSSQTGCTLAAPSSLVAPSASGPILALLRNPSGTTSTLATYAPDRPAGGPVSRHTLPDPTASCLAASGALLAIGAASGRVFVWSLHTGVLHTAFHAHFRGISRLCFTDDAEALLTAGVDASVQVYRTGELLDVTRPHDRAPKPARTLAGHTLPVVALAVGYAGCSARIVTASADRTARVWHLGSGLCAATIMTSCAPTEAVIAPDEAFAYVGLQTGDVVVAELASLPQTPVSQKSLPALRTSTDAAVSSMAVSPLGSEVIVGYADGIVRVFHVASRQIVASYARHGTTAVDCVRVLPERGNDPGLDGIVLGKVQDENAGDSEPLLKLCGRDAGAMACDAVRDAMEVAFGGYKRLEGRDGPGDRIELEQSGGEEGGQATAMQSGDSRDGAASAEVLRELEFLRRRNKELEEAGRKLIHLVEQRPG